MILNVPSILPGKDEPLLNEMVLCLPYATSIDVLELKSYAALRIILSYKINLLQEQLRNSKLLLLLQLCLVNLLQKDYVVLKQMQLSESNCLLVALI